MQLLILDVYGTIVARGARPLVRNGLFDLLNRFPHVAVATDDPDRAVIASYLECIGVQDRVTKLYTGQDLIRVPGFFGERKDLARICREHDVSAHEALFVSDGARDRADARRSSISFVHVPYFERADEPFSFSVIAERKTFPRYWDLRWVNRESAK